MQYSRNQVGKGTATWRLDFSAFGDLAVSEMDG